MRAFTVFTLGSTILHLALSSIAPPALANCAGVAKLGCAAATKVAPRAPAAIPKPAPPPTKPIATTPPPALPKAFNDNAVRSGTVNTTNKGGATVGGAAIGLMAPKRKLPTPQPPKPPPVAATASPAASKTLSVGTEAARKMLGQVRDPRSRDRWLAYKSFLEKRGAALRARHLKTSTQPTLSGALDARAPAAPSFNRSINASQFPPAGRTSGGGGKGGGGKGTGGEENDKWRRGQHVDRFNDAAGNPLTKRFNYHSKGGKGSATSDTDAGSSKASGAPIGQSKPPSPEFNP